MTVAIISFGLGNVRSLEIALHSAGLDSVVLSEPGRLGDYSRAVLPGVGAFDAAMERLRRGGWLSPLESFAAEARNTLVGICLGAQLLGTKSEEGKLDGLNLIPFDSVGLGKNCSGKSPHIGWSEVEWAPGFWNDALVDLRGPFYFNHGLMPNPKNGYSVASFAGSSDCVAAVGDGGVVGLQFHPERSYGPGARVLGRLLS